MSDILEIPHTSFYVGPQVILECSGCEAELRTCIAERRISELDDANLSFSVFSALTEKYDLGLGETECLAFAIGGNFSVCCDDKRARAMMIQEIGNGRVMGTLFLLRESVQYGLLTSLEAFNKYQLMKTKGGFLPLVAEDYFQTKLH